MSSDSISLVQNPETARLQRMQTLERLDRPQRAPEEGQVQRQASAASGQDLPLIQKQRVPGQTPVDQVESAVSQISDFIQNFQRDLVFSIDKDSERLVVKVVDSETQEVIRQIPSEETLRIAKRLDAADSLIFREQA